MTEGYQGHDPQTPYVSNPPPEGWVDLGWVAKWVAGRSSAEDWIYVQHQGREYRVVVRVTHVDGEEIEYEAGS